MGTKIDSVVRDCFPDELIDSNYFLDWCSEICQTTQPAAADLVVWLNRKLDSEKSVCIENCSIARDYWELFGGNGNKAIKSEMSIRSKLARDISDEKEKEKETEERKETIESLRARILNFSDLGRVRIVADYASDITYLRKQLFENGKFLGIYNCPKKIKDFVFDHTKRDGLKGHRALQFSARVPIDGTNDFFNFEVQLMTRLQHAWDRRNHPFYEWQRDSLDWTGNSKAVKLAVDDFACAETLHLVDRQADLNWQRLKKLQGAKKNE